MEQTEQIVYAVVSRGTAVLAEFQEADYTGKPLLFFVKFFSWKEGFVKTNKRCFWGKRKKKFFCFASKMTICGMVSGFLVKKGYYFEKKLNL